ncbi:MAG TPA: tail fiber domain-containing protein [Candidatus Acidoferrales bacterium]|nr:tail fiber domain-containing protein [Candidatus Acidoferrales bacterium]
MSFGSSQSSSNKIDPAILNMYTQNYADAQKVANQPFTPYTGQMTAPINADQAQAGLLYKNIATNQTGTAATNAATNAAGGLLNFNPNQVTPTPVNASTIAGTDLTPYENPFQSDVINATLAQNERARQMQAVADAQRASGSGAFGGSRSGVDAALTNEGYDRNLQGLLANLNSQNFSQAQSAAAQDAATRNQVGEFNATGDLTASNANAANGLTANSQNLAAAGLLGNLGAQQLDQAQQQAAGVNQFGTQEQQTQQAANDAAYQEFLRQIGWGAQQQNIKNAALSGFPIQQTTTTSSNPGLGGILSGVGSLASLIALSDERTKENITTAGYDAKGRRWVDFNYKGDDPRNRVRGVLAQEVRKTDPKAVIKVGNSKNGLLAVDYSKLKAA